MGQRTPENLTCEMQYLAILGFHHLQAFFLPIIAVERDEISGSVTSV